MNIQYFGFASDFGSNVLFRDDRIFWHIYRHYEIEDSCFHKAISQFRNDRFVQH